MCFSLAKSCTCIAQIYEPYMYSRCTVCVMIIANQNVYSYQTITSLANQQILTLSAMLECFSKPSCLPITLNVVLGPKRLHNRSAATVPVVQFLLTSCPQFQTLSSYFCCISWQFYTAMNLAQMNQPLNFVHALI